MRVGKWTSASQPLHWIHWVIWLLHKLCYLVSFASYNLKWLMWDDLQYWGCQMMAFGHLAQSGHKVVNLWSTGLLVATECTWSMTQVEPTKCKSHTVVNDTNAFGQWHKCRLLSLDHTQRSMTRMLLVNDTNADTHPRSAFYREWSMTRMLLVNDTNACYWV